MSTCTCDDLNVAVQLVGLDRRAAEALLEERAGLTPAGAAALVARYVGARSQQVDGDPFELAEDVAFERHAATYFT